ncbi:MAG: NAD(P)-binding domain-containing protein [Bacteroidales bacterium]|nr:NAD(P)-binding domain-containing protein [Bacteroidales bacterium]
MKIAVLGTGMVGDIIGSKLIELGHIVMMGSRTAGNEKAAAFVSKHPHGKASAGTFADAAAFGEIVFNCTKGMESINILKSTGENNLNGKILVDISNPLDFSQGMPPTLSVCNTNSLAEEIQKTFPGMKVVKTLHTMWCGLMVNPAMLKDGDHNAFMSGNDADAKKQVALILKSFGWIEKNIIDLGDIKTARGTEMILPLWLSIMGTTNSGAFNIKIIS